MATICLCVRDQLEALVDGELDADRAAELRGHLARCAECRAHHAEASSLPHRLAAIRVPDPPPMLLREVLNRVARERVSPLRLWLPLAVEMALFLVTLWYLSGLQGLYSLAQLTASDVGVAVSWGLGQSDLPRAPASDVFLLTVCGLLVATTLYHLALLLRQAPRPS